MGNPQRIVSLVLVVAGTARTICAVIVRVTTEMRVKRGSLIRRMDAPAFVFRRNSISLMEMS